MCLVFRFQSYSTAFSTDFLYQLVSYQSVVISRFVQKFTLPDVLSNNTYSLHYLPFACSCMQFMKM